MEQSVEKNSKNKKTINWTQNILPLLDRKHIKVSMSQLWYISDILLEQLNAILWTLSLLLPVAVVYNKAA